MRLGWLIPPSHLHADVVAAKHASDLGSPALPQLVLAHLLASGAYDRHLRLLRTRQRRRRDAILAALREHLPHARVQGVAAGLHLLITLPDLPDDTDDTDLAAVVRHAGVLVHRRRARRGPDGRAERAGGPVPERVRAAPTTALVRTPFGTMTLEGYLPTRRAPIWACTVATISTGSPRNSTTDRGSD